jgi:Uma2 family endonuclease
MVQSNQLPSPVTFEEAAALDANERSGELDRSRWIPMTRGTWRHGRIASNVVFTLKLYARQHAGWSVATADPGTRLRRNPDVLGGPDVGVIRVEREPTGKGIQGWLDGAPDLAVEVMGDDQRSSELKKALEYLAAGSRLVWILDPDAQQVIVVTPPDRIRVLGRGETLDGAEVLPGFSCSVLELFE